MSDVVESQKTDYIAISCVRVSNGSRCALRYNSAAMGHTLHLSRRELLDTIRMVGSAGAILLPLRGEKPDTSAKAVIRGSLRDGATGRPVAAKLRVTSTNSGQVYMPSGAIKTMPDRRHYFYARGSYEVAVPA